MQSLADPALDPRHTEKLIKGAKNEPAHFAFGLGQTPDKSVMEVDRSKSGKALFELCRKEAGARKGAYGTVRIDGTTAVFACEKDEISDLAKAVLAYFKAHKIGLKARLAEDSGPPGTAPNRDEPAAPRPEAREKA